MQTNNEVVIIGAGVIGLSIALALQTHGRKVSIVDRHDTALGASSMNAGAFAFSDTIPLATPGIMRKAPKWLIDPLGPLSIPPKYALKIAPWMLKFWRASWRDRFDQSLSTQGALMALSRRALEQQARDFSLGALLQREGQLQLYEGSKQFDAAQKGWALRKAQGMNFDLLDSAAAIAEIQPGLDERFTHAAYTPDWTNTVDPKRWTDALAQQFRDQGGVIYNDHVRAIEHDGARLILRCETSSFDADQVVVAAGAWSKTLAKSVGDNIPLETERGYNTTLPEGAFDLRTHLTFGEHGFVVTRINGGVRVGGAVELGGLELPPNYQRADVLLAKAKSFMPALNTQGGKQWMGFRPSMPDSLPVIGASATAPQVFYAFGHGHLGLTQSAGTGALVAALMTKKTPPIDPSPYSPTRF